MIRLLLCLLCFTQIVHGAAYQPEWAAIAPKRVIPHAGGDGAALVKAVEALQPGDKLEIAAGTYSVERMWDVRVSGTREAPIWITAAEGATVIITRPDAKQNLINIGQGGPVAFLCLRGLEFTGGSHGMRLGQCEDVWIDQCHIHHNDGPNLTANSGNTRRLFLTRNHLHHGGGVAEGMYLGANNGDHIMSESVIALNHVHDCRGDQGDGIEVKQGSWGNLIAENHIHDTNYPCITVYGTAGRPVNIIERNLCYNSGDNVMQVQGEAIVRNNVLINGAGAGFASTDHQGKTLNLQVIHNTILNSAHAFRGGSWNGREGMVLANNILYSRDANALLYANGNTGVISTGNVVFGDGPKDGCVKGRGFEDFPGVSLDGSKHDATPASDARFENADAKYLLPTDFNGKPRTQNISGAIAP
ncbi:MAG: hypothetical protein RLZZ476_193 [Verrucomicrobiota bacterium]|jgi:hypothetical protein